MSDAGSLRSPCGVKGCSTSRTACPDPNRPRVLLTNFHPRYSGGHASSILRIASSWLAEHFEFAVAAPQQSQVFDLCRQAGLNTFPCDFPGGVTEILDIVSSIHRFLRILRRFRPRIIHCNGGADLKIAAWSTPLSRRLKIIRHHRSIRRLDDDPYHRWLYNKRVSANVYVSHESMRISQGSGLIPASSCEVVYNGIDTDYFMPRRGEDGQRERLGIGPGDFVFGSCGGTDRYKRIDLLLQAAQRLKDRYPFKIVLVGDEAPIAALRALADELDVSDRLIYAGQLTDVRPVIACIDVGFVLSDRIETLSNAVREMMSMGKPILSSSYSGLVENFSDGVEGFFSTPGDTDATTAAMEAFLRLPRERLDDMGREARRRARDEFSPAKTLLPLYRLYQRLT